MAQRCFQNSSNDNNQPQSSFPESPNSFHMNDIQNQPLNNTVATNYHQIPPQHNAVQYQNSYDNRFTTEVRNTYSPMQSNTYYPMHQLLQNGDFGNLYYNRGINAPNNTHLYNPIGTHQFIQSTSYQTIQQQHQQNSAIVINNNNDNANTAHKTMATHYPSSLQTRNDNIAVHYNDNVTLENVNNNNLIINDANINANNNIQLNNRSSLAIEPNATLWMANRDADTQYTIKQLQKRLITYSNKKFKTLPKRDPPNPPDTSNSQQENVISNSDLCGNRSMVSDTNIEEKKLNETATLTAAQMTRIAVRESNKTILRQLKTQYPSLKCWLNRIDLPYLDSKGINLQRGILLKTRSMLHSRISNEMIDIWDGKKQKMGTKSFLGCNCVNSYPPVVMKATKHKNRRKKLAVAPYDRYIPVKKCRCGRSQIICNKKDYNLLASEEKFFDRIWNVWYKTVAKVLWKTLEGKVLCYRIRARSLKHMIYAFGAYKKATEMIEMRQQWDPSFEGVADCLQLELKLNDDEQRMIERYIFKHTYIDIDGSDTMYQDLYDESPFGDCKTKKGEVIPFQQSQMNHVSTETQQFVDYWYYYCCSELPQRTDINFMRLMTNPNQGALALINPKPAKYIARRLRRVLMDWKYQVYKQVAMRRKLNQFIGIMQDYIDLEEKNDEEKANNQQNGNDDWDDDEFEFVDFTLTRNGFLDFFK
eukprot:280596_1